MDACAPAKPVTIVWNSFCPSFRGSRQARCIASCILGTFRIIGSLYSWSRQVVENTCHFSDNGRGLNITIKSASLVLRIRWRVPLLWDIWRGFLEHTNSFCVIPAGHCSEIQAKVTAAPHDLTLTRALVSSARHGAEQPGLPWGLLGWGVWFIVLEGSCCCSYLSRFYFPSTLWNISQTAFHGTRKVLTSGRASCCFRSLSSVQSPDGDSNCTWIIQSQQWRVREDWHPYFAYQTRDECVVRVISGRPGFRAHTRGL